MAARLAGAPLSYPEIGSTTGKLPASYSHVRRSALLGWGPRAFANAVAALMAWQLHLRADVDVWACGPPVAGTDVLLRARIGPVRIAGPCRVVYVIEQPGCAGFAYGTMTGHPETGEESFIVRQGDDEAVVLAVTAFSRPAGWLARAAGPLGRAAQGQITDRYLRALAENSRQ